MYLQKGLQLVEAPRIASNPEPIPNDVPNRNPALQQLLPNSKIKKKVPLKAPFIVDVNRLHLDRDDKFYLNAASQLKDEVASA